MESLNVALAVLELFVDQPSLTLKVPPAFPECWNLSYMPPCPTAVGFLQIVSVLKAVQSQTP